MSDSDHQAVLLPPHVTIGDEITFGPGKIELLRKLGEGHSISSAARALGMTYKRAWALVDTLNRGFPSRSWKPPAAEKVAAEHVSRHWARNWSLAIWPWKPK